MQPEDIGPAIMMLVWAGGVISGTALLLRQRGFSIWPAFIPFVNFAALCRLAGLSAWWTAALCVPLLNLAVVIFVALRLADRYGMSQTFGIWLGITGLALVPFVHFKGTPPADDFAPREDSLSLPNRVATPVTPEERAKSARAWAVVFTVVHGFCLLCLPGFFVIGAMAFDGANAKQIKQYEGPLALACLMIPVSLIATMALTWYFFRRKQYRLSLGVNGLPALSFLFAFAVVVMALA